MATNLRLWIQGFAGAVGFLLTGFIFAMATWDMFGTIVGLVDNLLLKGIFWAGYLIILALWIVIMPAYKAFGSHFNAEQ